MSEEQFSALIDFVVRLVDIAGVIAIAGGILLVTALSVLRLTAGPKKDARGDEGDDGLERNEDAYHTYRRRVGKAMLLGLELLVAADIIRTVAVRPTLEGVAVLGLLVLVRTFLSFSLEVELYGRWPWQRGSRQ